jgi:hypothetical protein
MFRLALALGRTVQELEQTMGSGEFSEWKAYYATEPFGQWRDNFHAAQIASILHNVNRGKGAAVTPDDFIYRDMEDTQDRADAEVLARLNILGIRKN